ncbi:hypothetical protein A6R68_16467 [Neotoma lepida]|uniref:Uncharacterized protein n=1 Tax=Neotoma lepida TaxID=56216 RepID=A0A1A6HEQ1_NEOLE|nr:hypothetical protein A6R68_16467 [Neotoma lepida]
MALGNCGPIATAQRKNSEQDMRTLIGSSMDKDMSQNYLVSCELKADKDDHLKEGNDESDVISHHYNHPFRGWAKHTEAMNYEGSPLKVTLATERMATGPVSAVDTDHHNPLSLQERMAEGGASGNWQKKRDQISYQTTGDSDRSTFCRTLPASSFCFGWDIISSTLPLLLLRLWVRCPEGLLCLLWVGKSPGLALLDMFLLGFESLKVPPSSRTKTECVKVAWNGSGSNPASNAYQYNVAAQSSDPRNHAIVGKHLWLEGDIQGLIKSPLALSLQLKVLSVQFTELFVLFAH